MTPRSRARTTPPIGSLRSSLAAGFLTGLAAGIALAAWHLGYNQTASPRDGALVALYFAALYGSAAAAVFAVGYGLAAVLARVAARRRVGRPGSGGDAEESPRDRPLYRGPVYWGSFLLLLGFWELYFLYGITYDQIPFGPPADAGGMLVALLLLAVLIALGAAGLAWPLGRVLVALVPRAGRWIGGLLALGILGGASLPLTVPEAPPAALETAEPPAIATRATGLKVALLGLDGADWRVLRPLMERGELPAFSAIVAEGASGPLATLPDANSAVIWASLYSGTTPAVHGIHDFYRIELAGLSGPGLFPVHRTFFKELAGLLGPLGLARLTAISRFSVGAPLIWEVADHLGRSTGVIDGYLYSFPAQAPTVEGSYFLAYGLPDFARRFSGAGRDQAMADVGLFVQPPELFPEIRPLLVKDDFYWQSEALLGPLSALPQPDLLSFYTHEPDTVQHWSWRAYQPQAYLGVSQEEIEASGEAIAETYRAFDAFLAELRARLEPDTVLAIVSDHGHSPTLTHTHDTQHRHGPDGILLLAGGPVRSGLALDDAHVYDLFPTLCALLGLPIPDDAAGRVLEEAIDPGFLAAHPPARIPTYRGLWQLVGPGIERDEEMNRLEIERLKALGYL